MAKQFRNHPFSGLTTHKDLSAVSYQVGGVAHLSNAGWFRGENANFLPDKLAMRVCDNFGQSFLHGWLPKEKFITRTTKILTFGSCFAANIAKALGSNGYNLLATQYANRSSNVYTIACNEGIVNTFTMRQMFDWLYAGKRPDASTWHDYSAHAYEFSDENRASTLEVFRETELFIITLGLSEVWYDKVTGAVYSRAIPAADYNPDRHAFRVSTVAENKENIARIYELIRSHHPKARVVLTLSPVPLVATFRPVSCITASAVSKAVLRVAVDEVLRENEGDGALHYWPSYEIVTHGFPDSFVDDNRHVRDEILNYIMGLFQASYCQDIDIPLGKLYYDAALATGIVPLHIGNKLGASPDRKTVIDLMQRLIRARKVTVPIIVFDRWLSEHPDDSEIREHRERLWQGIVAMKRRKVDHLVATRNNQVQQGLKRSA